MSLAFSSLAAVRIRPSDHHILSFELSHDADLLRRTDTLIPDSMIVFSLPRRIDFLLQRFAAQKSPQGG
jgi:hypothetical protein